MDLGLNYRHFARNTDCIAHEGMNGCTNGVNRHFAGTRWKFLRDPQRAFSPFRPLTATGNSPTNAAMTSRILLALALVLAGCSTFNKTELAQIRQRGLRPELLGKLEHRRALEPDDLIELRRARVDDELVVRQLEDVGINYLVPRSDAARLRAAHVSPRVLDALIHASERFARREAYDPYEDGWFYADPWTPQLYGDWTIDFSAPVYGHRRWHR